MGRGVIPDEAPRFIARALPPPLYQEVVYTADYDHLPSPFPCNVLPTDGASDHYTTNSITCNPPFIHLSQA